MKHTHAVEETQVQELRRHLRVAHGLAEDALQGATGRGLVWLHNQHHPDHTVVDPNKSDLKLRVDPPHIPEMWHLRPGRLRG